MGKSCSRAFQDELLFPFLHVGPPGDHTVFIDRQTLVVNDQIPVNPHNTSKPFADRTSAKWVIEAEQMRRGLLETHPVHFKSVGKSIHLTCVK